MQIENLTVEYDGTKENIQVRRFGFRERAKLFTTMQQGTIDSPNGAVVRFDVAADFTVKLIVKSVCDANGKSTLTEDQVDEWPDAKISAYTKALRDFQSPSVEDVAKNSSTTGTNAS